MVTIIQHLPLNSQPMDTATYLRNLEQQQSYLETEILLLQKHLKLKQRSLAIIRNELHIITRPTDYRTRPHPLEYSPRSLELYYNDERLRFQGRLCSLSLNVPTPTTISYEERYQQTIDELRFHRYHYHFMLAHSRIPPDPKEYF